jgi:hypothetical protein
MFWTRIPSTHYDALSITLDTREAGSSGGRCHSSLHVRIGLVFELACCFQSGQQLIKDEPSMGKIGSHPVSAAGLYTSLTGIIHSE